MKKQIITVLSLILCSCASDAQSSTPETQTTITTAVATTVTSGTKNETVTEPVKPEPVYKNIKAEITGYKDEKLSFTYDGKDYVIDMDEKLFNTHNELTRTVGSEKLISELVINNPYSETVIGKITLTEDMSEIAKCDVITPNVKEYYGKLHYLQNGKPDPAYYYSFKKTGGSKCVISNPDETLEFDMCSLSWNNLRILKDEYPLVSFTAYRFHDGNMILGSVYPADIADDGYLFSRSDNGQYKECVQYPISYFGTVQKVENYKADILLNDGKTIITVPSYYSDGDVTVGSNVLVQLELEEEKLYGTGKHAEFDLAFINTKEKYYNRTMRKFEELAYAAIAKDSTAYYDYYSTTGEKVERL